MKTMKRTLVLALCIVTIMSLFVLPAYADTMDDAAQFAPAQTIFAKSVAVKSIKLNKSSVSLIVGETFQLKATITPSNASNKSVTYSSSNNKVATVSSKGLIKAASAGTAVITAKTNNGKTATVKVIVKKPVCEVVKLNKTSITMLGKPVQLKVSGASGTITWSTSNKKIATVSGNGLVTPKGYGTCTITAKTKNGSKVTCSVEVKQTNKITRSFTPATVTWNVYKMSDTMTIVVDGLTGKIKKSETDCYQSKRDWAILASISPDGIECYSQESNCAYFRSKYTVNIGLIGLGKIKLGVDAVTVTYYYKLESDGTLKFMKGECDDLLGICAVDKTYYIIDNNGNFVATKERP